MSPIGLALDLLLIALLLAALAFGWRLERRLKALRDSQAGFVKAVQDLDGAAARAEQGLDTLRRTTEDARVELSDRLDEARDLIRRLEQITAAGAVAPTPPRAPPPRAARVEPAAPQAPRAFPEAATGAASDDLFDQEADLAAALRELRRRRSAE